MATYRTGNYSRGFGKRRAWWISFEVLKMMVGNNLKDSQLQQIVDKTILFHDKDGDGRISFQEFCDVSSHFYSKTFMYAAHLQKQMRFYTCQ
ncbi:unnamed protein product [Cylicostephanus goldi]|uniref:EF-hand domain-containing protein n=1 Tax=Cylicostephanus goldi TaxID=71465 RepID=A0A3P6UCW1_CYLGO|nr:unnamed protein product [Cylicostephanus goldi]